jgi:hypothetical protein
MELILFLITSARILYRITPRPCFQSNPISTDESTQHNVKIEKSKITNELSLQLKIS